MVDGRVWKSKENSLERGRGFTKANNVFGLDIYCFLDWECESTKFFNTPDKMIKIFIWHLNDRILILSRY